MCIDTAKGGKGKKDQERAPNLLEEKQERPPEKKKKGKSQRDR